MTVTIDRAGRVVLPKAIRDRFHLVPGTELELTVGVDGVRLATRETLPSLVSTRGVLIHQGHARSDIDIVAFINQSRESRGADLIGG